MIKKNIYLKYKFESDTMKAIHETRFAFLVFTGFRILSNVDPARMIYGKLKNIFIKYI